PVPPCGEPHAFRAHVPRRARDPGNPVPRPPDHAGLPRLRNALDLQLAAVRPPLRDPRPHPDEGDLDAPPAALPADLRLRLSPPLHRFPDARGDGRNRGRLHPLREARVDRDRRAAPLLAGDSSVVLARTRAGVDDRGKPLDLARARRADVVPAVRGGQSTDRLRGVLWSGSAVAEPPL